MIHIKKERFFFASPLSGPFRKSFGVEWKLHELPPQDRKSDQVEHGRRGQACNRKKKVFEGIRRVLCAWLAVTGPGPKILPLDLLLPPPLRETKKRKKKESITVRFEFQFLSFARKSLVSPEGQLTEAQLQGSAESAPDTTAGSESCCLMSSVWTLYYWPQLLSSNSTFGALHFNILNTFVAALTEDENTYSFFQQDGATTHTLRRTMNSIYTIFTSELAKKNLSASGPALEKRKEERKKRERENGNFRQVIFHEGSTSTSKIHQTRVIERNCSGNLSKEMLPGSPCSSLDGKLTPSNLGSLEGRGTQFFPPKCVRRNTSVGVFHALISFYPPFTSSSPPPFPISSENLILSPRTKASSRRRLSFVGRESYPCMHPNLKRRVTQRGGSPQRRSDWVTKEFNENLKPLRGKENPPRGYDGPRHALPKGRIKKEKWSSLKHKGATPTSRVLSHAQSAHYAVFCPPLHVSPTPFVSLRHHPRVSRGYSIRRRPQDTKHGDNTLA
ncbi:hypothetical protein TNCV_1500921 [Trichonephila clavipes]|uniref:Uncharacterized protein n=1 Tax=Trichonephila clavipes TaxID=2585209 RepID=A0A8X6RTE0_TRICX|nr:hypothetical protein TNCV_1500921 [Trichonephila clavipes]